MLGFQKIDIILLGLFIVLCSCSKSKNNYTICSSSINICLEVDTALNNLEIDTLRSSYLQPINLRFTFKHYNTVNLLIYVDSIANIPDDYLVCRPLFYFNSLNCFASAHRYVLLEAKKYKLFQNDAATVHFCENNSETIVTEINYKNEYALNILLSQQFNDRNSVNLWDLNQSIVENISIKELK